MPSHYEPIGAVKRNHYHSLIRLITGPQYIMLLIILLSAIAQLVAVSADCDLEPPKYNITDWTNVSYSVVSLTIPM
jgi:hypothetical protein